MWPLFWAIAAAAVVIVGSILALAAHVARCERCRRPANPNSVAALRDRENADQLPKYPRPRPDEWRDR